MSVAIHGMVGHLRSLHYL